MSPRKAADPRRHPFTDLDLANWKDLLPEVETGSLWRFTKRDKGETHVGDYHGNFIPQVPQQLIRRFTRADDVVVDLFLGMGTTLIECRRMGRHGIGVELLPHVATAAQERIEAAQNGQHVVTQVVVGDSASSEARERVREVLGTLGRAHADLVILHPPYSDIIKFSAGSRAEDLSNVQSDADFIERFRPVLDNARELLAPGRFMALVIGDKYEGGAWVPLGFRCMDAAIAAGFVLKSIIVKDIQGNEKGKGKNGNLWRYRALAQGYYLFKHEYVFLFQRPKRASRAGSAASRTL